jgi:hypothetical protein
MMRSTTCVPAPSPRTLYTVAGVFVGNPSGDVQLQEVAVSVRVAGHDLKQVVLV